MFANMNPAVLFDMEKYHPAAFKKYMDFKNGFMYQMIRTNIERGIAEELYRSEIDVDIMTRYRIHSIMLAFSSDIFPNNRTHIVHMNHNYWNISYMGWLPQRAKADPEIQKSTNQKINA
jgi:hypothetical protein